LAINPKVPERAESNWPPVVVASVFQTGLNLMRDLERHGVRAIGVDCHLEHEGFRSIYGKSHACPDPDSHPEQWLDFMRTLSRDLGTKPVLIPAADQFVSAMGRHSRELREHFIFSTAAVEIQANLATKEQQYALANQLGFPCPRTAYIQSRAELQEFVEAARFPCLLKPRQQREWEALPGGNPLKGRKLISAETAELLLDYYAQVERYRPEVMAQEIIAGGDDAKYCYLSVYGSGGSRMGACVVREFRAYPLQFGSASIVEPVEDREIETLCDEFLRAIHYVGICEIEVKRDERDGKVKLIEVNPRFSGTGDCAIYTGVEVGWLHYLDLIGRTLPPVDPVRFDFRHITLRRDLPSIPRYFEQRTITWRELIHSYRRPVVFFDFDLRDWRVTAMTLRMSLREMIGTALRVWGLRS
jgi:D-aspartate ligase